MSILKVNTIQDKGGNAIISSDGSGTVTVNNDALKATPSFEAYNNANQTVSDNTHTKLQFNTEVYDTDGCYDNSTNYRFTPTVAGKYFVYASGQAETEASQLQFTQISIYKNGSQYAQRNIDFRSNNGLQISANISAIVDMNGSSDYVEIYGKIFKGGGSTIRFKADSTSEKSMQFGAYRIIGA